MTAEILSFETGRPAEAVDGEPSLVVDVEGYEGPLDLFLHLIKKAELDPADTSAFLTGLTFVKDGAFTGTMTPLTEDVTVTPEPASLAVVAFGLFGFAATCRWRRKSALPRFAED